MAVMTPVPMTVCLTPAWPGTGPTAALSLGGNNRESSGFIIGNNSRYAGMSQIYFGSLRNGDAVQASQAGLQ